MSEKTVYVDAHHHLWDLSAVNYPWLMEKGVRRFFGDPAPIQKDYLIDDFRADIGDLPISRSVHVQVGARTDHAIRETRWLQSVADERGSGGMPQAIVAFCDLSAKQAVDQLEEQLTYPNIRGIRQIVGRAADEDRRTGSGALLENATWRENLARLSGLGLSFDLQLVPPQLPKVTEILRHIPELPVALCHCGSPWDRSPAGLAFWREQIDMLARLPNVYCKLSGFGMFDPDWNAARIRDIVMPVVDAFGPERCMFGSNFPVDKLYRDYRSLWNDYAALCAGFGEGEREALLGETARRFYRLS